MSFLSITILLKHSKFQLKLYYFKNKTLFQNSVRFTEKLIIQSVPIYAISSFSYDAHIILIWYIFYDYQTNIDSLLLTKVHILFTFAQLLPNVLFLIQEPIQDTTLTLLSCFLRLFLIVTVSQNLLVCNDLDSFEEYWSGMFWNIPLKKFV